MQSRQAADVVLQALRMAAQQVATICKEVLLPEFQNLIAFVDYEEHVDILDAANDPDAAELAEFLRERIRRVVG
ncbi:hypothetical protein [Acidimangrovimonas pyrenivorans]|uniref:Uncharacterized protein n=1 Tax=Acidimangrovimonas pyrenivorans TaxID=2030798 RepID=A0ABV7AH39_9RHOB